MPTDYRSLYDKDYIGAWDLTDGDKTIKITRVKGGELHNPGTKKKTRKPVVYFEGSEKGFCLNATNGKTIAGLYGVYTEKWVGKSITIYKSMTRSPDGSGDVECLRVRPTAPKSTDRPAASAPTPAPPSQDAEAGGVSGVQELIDMPDDLPFKSDAKPAKVTKEQAATLQTLCEEAGSDSDAILAKVNAMGWPDVDAAWYAKLAAGFEKKIAAKQQAA